MRKPRHIPNLVKKFTVEVELELKITPRKIGLMEKSSQNGLLFWQETPVDGYLFKPKAYGCINIKGQFTRCDF